jgi:DNA-binding XRE family transcriptional regulator
VNSLNGFFRQKNRFTYFGVVELIFPKLSKNQFNSLKNTVKYNIYLKSIFMISSLHIKLSRTALGLTQEQVAKKSTVSLPTIKKIETTHPNNEIKSNRSTIVALLKFFEDSGVELINENDLIGVKVGKSLLSRNADDLNADAQNIS